MMPPDRLGQAKLINRLKTHPLRELLYEEVHGRPPPFVSTPVSVSHIVFLADERGLDESFEHVVRLAGRFGADVPNSQASCYYHQLGEFKLRWERHTEFSAYTFIRTGVQDPPFAGTALQIGRCGPLILPDPPHKGPDPTHGDHGNRRKPC